MKQKIIEEWFPLKEISRDAGIEMAYKSIPAYIKHLRELGLSTYIGRNFYDPKIRNLHPWFARRPCSVARTITLASILNNKIDKNLFLDILGWNEKIDVYLKKSYPPLLFYTNPKRDAIKNILKEEGLNPDEIIVCDPMAGGGSIPFESLNLGFKTIAIDYNPLAYIILKATIEYPSKYGIELADRVENEAKDLILFVEKELNNFYPENVDGYIIARGIHCPKCNGLIPLIHNSEITGKYNIGFYFNKDKTFTPYISKSKIVLEYVKKNHILCPYCGNKINKKDFYKIWTQNHIEILNDIINGLINEEKILSTHILLVKQTKKDYKIADNLDIEAFIKSCKFLSKYFNEIKMFLPNSKITDENEVFKNLKNYGIEFWYQLFNPRQIVSIALIIKYINDKIKSLKSNDFIGKVSMLYLALSISRVIDYNSILTTWKKGTIRDTLGQYARNRKISYGESYCEAIVPKKNIRWIFETDFDKRTQGGILPILKEICKKLNGLGDRIKIIHGDARKLSYYLNEKVDLINVDPPYFDTHIYSDISEYFWQILKIFNELLNDKFIFETKLEDWKLENLSVPRDGEIIVRKKRNNDQNKYNEIWYAEQMLEFFKQSYNVLKDDGLLVVWFTHRTLNAWKSLISALYGSNFYITRIWPVTTELLTRLVAKNNNNVLDRTLLIIARKKKEISIDMELYAEKLAFETLNALKEITTSKDELKTFLYAAILSSITVMPLKDKENPINYCYEILIPNSLKIAENLITKIMKEFLS